MDKTLTVYLVIGAVILFGLAAYAYNNGLFFAKSTTPALPKPTSTTKITCTDGDGGANYDKAGAIKMIVCVGTSCTTKTESDYCTGNAVTYKYNKTTTDASGRTVIQEFSKTYQPELVEYSCNPSSSRTADNTIMSKTINCAAEGKVGCQENQCVAELATPESGASETTTITCTDMGSYVKLDVCINTICTRTYHNDICIGPERQYEFNISAINGTGTIVRYKETLEEYYCNPSPSRTPDNAVLSRTIDCTISPMVACQHSTYYRCVSRLVGT
jgi:hypothetical protein